jgi:hypothetical protein
MMVYITAGGDRFLVRSQRFSVRDFEESQEKLWEFSKSTFEPSGVDSNVAFPCRSCLGRIIRGFLGIRLYLI